MTQQLDRDAAVREAAPSRRAPWWPLLLAAAAVVPGLAVQWAGSGVGSEVQAAAMGLAIIGAAFVLSWAAEVAQIDVPRGLALALLALVAVLPEYAVDVVFAWKAGNDPEQWAPLALANMTGANRLLIGVGWSMVVVVALLSRRNGHHGCEVAIPERKRVEVGFLIVATLYSLSLPLRGSITLIDTVVLLAIFGAYALRLARGPAPEPELDGTPSAVASLSRPARRVATIAMFAGAGAVILAVAGPFADALVQTGVERGIDRFLLVQWLAPIASESPELLAAGLLAYRSQPGGALAVLVSSKVNQWTLLVGIIPAVFAVSAASLGGFPLDAVQRQELLLTSAQSAFAVAILARLRLSIGAALVLVSLFLAELVGVALAPASLRPEIRLSFAAVYLVLAVGVAWHHRRGVARAVRHGVLGRDREPNAARSEEG